MASSIVDAAATSESNPAGDSQPSAFSQYGVGILGTIVGSKAVLIVHPSIHDDPPRRLKAVPPRAMHASLAPSVAIARHILPSLDHFASAQNRSPNFSTSPFQNGHQLTGRRMLEAFPQTTGEDWWLATWSMRNMVTERPRIEGIAKRPTHDGGPFSVYSSGQQPAYRTLPMLLFTVSCLVFIMLEIAV